MPWPNPVVLGRKHCSQCRRWRPAIDFSAMMDKRYGVLRLRSSCQCCERLKARVRQGCGPTRGLPDGRARQTHCIRGHPLEGPDADVYIQRSGRRRCRRCVRIRQTWDTNREYHRIYQEAMRRERGVPMRKLTRPTPRVKGEAGWIDAAPFVAWLLESFPGQKPEAFAGKIALDPRQIRSYLTHEMRQIHVDTVDRALVVSGEPGTLRILYPDLYDEGMAT